jgi:hypothetical protein
MKQIWGIINTLQILTLLPMIVPRTPANVKMCLQILEDVSNLKIIPQGIVDEVLSAFGVNGV